jgi:hypothetical protein
MYMYTSTTRVHVHMHTRVHCTHMPAIPLSIRSMVQMLRERSECGRARPWPPSKRSSRVAGRPWSQRRPTSHARTAAAKQRQADAAARAGARRSLLLSFVCCTNAHKVLEKMLLQYSRERKNREKTGYTSAVFLIFLVLDEMSLVLRYEGPNVDQKKLKDEISTFCKFEGPKTYFSLLLMNQECLFSREKNGDFFSASTGTKRITLRPLPGRPGHRIEK